MQFLNPLYQGVICAFSNTNPIVQFEQALIIGSFLALLLLGFNVLAIIKLIYINLRKKRKSHASGKTLKLEEAGILDLTSSHSLSGERSFFFRLKILLSKVLTAFKDAFKFYLRIASRPFDIKSFSRRSKKKISLKLWKFQLKIPYLLIWGIWFLIVNIAVIAVNISFYNKYFRQYPKIISTYPEHKQYWDDYERPVEILFDIPINKDQLIINMAPETDGEWEFEKSFSFLPFTRKINFYPSETVFPGEEVMVYLTDLTNHFHTMHGGEHLIEFNSIHLPIIESTLPENQEVNAPTDQEIVLNLNQKDGPYVEWEFVLDKENTFQITRNFDKTIKLTFDNNLNQGETYKFEIYQTPLAINLESGEVTKKGEKQHVYTLEFTTVAAPLVSSMSPTEAGILVDEVIRVVFDTEMEKEDVENVFSINPEIGGEISWEDDKTFVFTPAEPLTKETHYEVIFTQGIRSKVGGVTESDITFSFDTIGPVKVIGWSPGPGAGNVKTTSSIHVVFDQGVDHGSAQSSFSISPVVPGTFSWSGNTMIFSHSSPFGYSTKYTVTIRAGVKTIHGLDSRNNFSMSFTTESNVFMLNVPLYKQAHAFTCNLTAIAMALAYKGAPSSEMGVYNGIAKDNTPCTKNGDIIEYWGNPNVGYVGDIDGGGTCGGYGVHWGPAAAYINSRGRTAVVHSGWNVVSLVQEVEKGNPVVIWWQNGWANPNWPPKNWNSPTGYVHGVNGMHSEVVIGFIGPSSNPSHIITNDPWRGRRTLTVSYFNSMWGYFNRTGVVVY